MRYIWNIQSMNNHSPYIPIGYSNIPEQEYERMGNIILNNDNKNYSIYGVDTYNYDYQVETNNGLFVLIYDKKSVYYIDRKGHEKGTK